MKTKLFLLSTAAALSCGALTLLAQDAPAPPPPGGEGRPPGGEGRPPGPPPGSADRLAEFIKRSDTDGDGKISKEEFVNSTKKQSEDQFSKIDANADGFVDKTEIEEEGRRMREMREAGGRPPGGPGPEGGPGGMRRPEGGSPDGFRRPEGSGDGSRPRPGQEGPEGFRRPEGGGPEGFRRPEGGEGMRRPGGEGGRPPGSFGLLSGMDKDGDGILTKEEFVGSLEERFAQMDGDKDGKVTREESEAYGRRMREMMGGGEGFRRPGGEGGEGGFRRPGGEGGNRPEGERPKRPEGEAPAPPKE